MIIKTYMLILYGFLTFAAFSNLFAQDVDLILAKVGSKNITIEEFKNRFDFMPHLNFSNSNIDTLKKEFLYSLIAEKLWAAKAEQLDYNKIDEIKYSLKTLEKLFVKDEFYKKEVYSKIILSNEEINFGLLNVSRILYSNIISSNDSTEIHYFYNQLINGTNFDSLLFLKKQIPNKLQQHKIKFGDLKDENLERLVFNLKQNHVSKPIKSNDNWFIFKVINEDIDSTITLGTEHAKNKVISIIRNRKEKKLADSVFNDIFGERKILADGKLFENLIISLYNVLEKRLKNRDIDSLADLQITQMDIINVLKSHTQKELTLSFIDIDSAPTTLKDFLYYLIYQKIFLKKFELNHLKNIIKAEIRSFIESEVLYREAIKKGVNKLVEVENDLNLWKDYYLSEALMQSYADSIILDKIDIENYLLNTSENLDSIKQVDIIEILISNLSDAESILDKINKGIEFEKLAEEYNERPSTKNTNGRWGYFPINFGGEIGRIASELDINEIYGPLKLPEGYSIFKLVGKKNNEILKINSTPIDTNLIRLQIALNKMDKLITDKTISFAKQFEIKINEDLLNRLELSSLDSFTYRLIGFGGKIAAFPITVPMYEWFKYYKENKKLP